MIWYCPHFRPLSHRMCVRVCMYFTHGIACAVHVICSPFHVMCSPVYCMSCHWQPLACHLQHMSWHCMSCAAHVMAWYAISSAFLYHFTQSPLTPRSRSNHSPNAHAAITHPTLTQRSFTSRSHSNYPPHTPRLMHLLREGGGGLGSSRCGRPLHS